MESTMAAHTPELLTRAQGEYLEMPGLSLTLAQAQRLWALDSHTCRQVLSLMVDAGFLKQRSDGTYIRRASGRLARIA